MCSFWMTFLRNDYIHILSEECYVKYLNLLWREAVVLDITVTYSLETWKPYYASSDKHAVSYEMNTQWREVMSENLMCSVPADGEIL